MTDEQADTIANAERENHRDRPKDAISLLCAVAVAQHRLLLKHESRLASVERRLAKLEPTW